MIDELVCSKSPLSISVWRFHKGQFLVNNPNGADLKIGYNYYKDVERGAYSANDIRDPTGIDVRVGLNI